MAIDSDSTPYFLNLSDVSWFREYNREEDLSHHKDTILLSCGGTIMRLDQESSSTFLGILARRTEVEDFYVLAR